MLKLTSRQTSILTHLLFWLCYAIIIFKVFSGFGGYRHGLERTALLVVVQSLVFYVNGFWLLPKLFEQKKLSLYILSALLLFIITVWGMFLFDRQFAHDLPFQRQEVVEQRDHRRSPKRHHHKPPSPRPQVMARHKAIFNGLSLISVFFISTLYRNFNNARKRERQELQLNREKVEAEMKFLKSQINPHFLFNAMNNLYSLAVSESEKTPEVILKLSDMLRYVLYECNDDRVPLRKEMGYISNYIDLQKLRDDNIQNVHFHYDDASLNRVIAPMLLIPFVENAFKHSNIEDTGSGYVAIDLQTADGRLYFKVENSLPETPGPRDQQGGVGLANVKRRLELSYPNAYELKVEALDGKFLVELEIKQL